MNSDQPDPGESDSKLADSADQRVVEAELPASPAESSQFDALDALLAEFQERPELLRDPALRRSILRKISLLSWSAPLPPPDILADYDDVVPGAASRILDEFHLEGTHRRSMDTSEFELTAEVIRADVRRADLGLRLAFVLAVLFGAAAVFVAVDGREIAASVLGGGTLAVIVIGFLKSGRGPDAPPPRTNSHRTDRDSRSPQAGLRLERRTTVTT